MRNRKVPSACRPAPRSAPIGIAPACGGVAVMEAAPAQVQHRACVRRAIRRFDCAPWSLLRARAGAIALLALIASHHALALEAVAETPDNATQTRYGGRWDCDRGYRENNGSCRAVELPANAYATDSSFGAGWECRRGFSPINGACVPISVPANAYLSAGRGDTWKCVRGFRKTDNACIRIRVPANGFLSTSAYGSGWECERGFRAVDESCVAFVVPENAHINRSGNDWACDRPYRKTHEACEIR